MAWTLLCKISYQSGSIIHRPFNLSFAVYPRFTHRVDKHLSTKEIDKLGLTQSRKKWSTFLGSNIPLSDVPQMFLTYTEIRIILDWYKWGRQAILFRVKANVSWSSRLNYIFKNVRGKLPWMFLNLVFLINVLQDLGYHNTSFWMPGLIFASIIYRNFSFTGWLLLDNFLNLYHISYVF